jgi:hypothetical protein
VRCECHEQAFVALPSSAPDALGDPLRIQSRASESEPIILMMSDVSACQFVVAGPDCTRDGGDQAMRFIEVGSCSLQEK